MNSCQVVHVWHPLNQLNRCPHHPEENLEIKNLIYWHPHNIHCGQEVTIPLVNIPRDESLHRHQMGLYVHCCLKHSLMHQCYTCWSICGVMVVNVCSTPLCNLSFLWYRAATCPLTVPHKEPSGVLRSGLCSGLGNVCSECCAQWGWNVQVLHRATATDLPWILSLSCCINHASNMFA